MNKLLIVIGATLGLSLLPQVASAVVINFEDNGLTSNTGLNPVLSSGFSFDHESLGGIIVNPTDCLPDCASNGTKYHNVFGLSVVTTMTHVGGGLFTLLSVDLAELFTDRPDSVTHTVTVEGFLSGGGSVTTVFTLDGVVDSVGGAQDFETFNFSSAFSGLTSAVFSGHNLSGSPSGGLGLDNINVSVPEPGTLALFGLGLAGLGFARRKRDKAA